MSGLALKDLPPGTVEQSLQCASAYQRDCISLRVLPFTGADSHYIVMDGRLAGFVITSDDGQLKIVGKTSYPIVEGEEYLLRPISTSDEKFLFAPQEM